MEPAREHARLRQLMRESLERLRRFQQLGKELERAKALQAQNALEQRRQARLQADELMRQAWLLKHQGSSASHSLSRRHSSTDVLAHVSSRGEDIATGHLLSTDVCQALQPLPSALKIPTVMIELYPEQQPSWLDNPSPSGSSSSSARAGSTQAGGEEGPAGGDEGLVISSMNAAQSNPTPSAVLAPATPEPAAASRRGVNDLCSPCTSSGQGQEAIRLHSGREHLIGSSVNRQAGCASDASYLFWEQVHELWEVRWFGS